MRTPPHLLRRAEFGGTQADVDELEALSRTAAVDLIMDFSHNPAAVPPPETYNETIANWEVMRELRDWWVDRMHTVPRGLQEKLALFFHDHFATESGTAEYAWQMWEQNELFRNMGLGSFRDLVQAVSISPAMLLFLDNATSVARKPERELRPRAA